MSFEVHRWFKGATAPEVGVWIENLNIESSVGAVEAEPGTRLLVSGEPRWGGDPLEDPIAWPCGFTQPWRGGGCVRVGGRFHLILGKGEPSHSAPSIRPFDARPEPGT